MSCYRGWPYIYRERELSVVTALSRADFCREGNELNPTHTTSTNTFSPATHASHRHYHSSTIHTAASLVSLFSGRCNVRGRHLHSPICRGVNALPLPFFSPTLCVCVYFGCVWAVQIKSNYSCRVCSYFFFVLFCFVFRWFGVFDAIYTTMWRRDGMGRNGAKNKRIVNLDQGRVIWHQIKQKLRCAPERESVCM